MMKETVDSLSNQKIINYSLNGTFTKTEFIKELTNDLPEPPAYFPANVKLNQEGYDDLSVVMNNSLNLISPDEYKELIKSDDITILDTRDSVDFVKYHLPNSIFIGLNGRFAPWVGEILKDVNTRIIFICISGKEKEVVIKMTLTSPNCPVADSLQKQVKDYILKVKGVSDVKLNLVWDPPWDKSKMSEAAKLELNL